MIKTGPNDTNQLMTSVDRLRIWPLVIAPVPLLRASLHLSHVIGCQGQMLETMTSGHGTGGNEVIQGESIKGTESAPWTLNSLVDRLSRRINHIWIVMSGSGVLDIVPPLELLEALSASVVDVLGVGDELGRRRRSVGSRHFEWRTG